MARVFVAGHRGMVGSAIVRALEIQGGSEILTQNHSELDLTRQAEVEAYFEHNAIDQVYLAAAKVGGIHANNTYPADFIYQNLQMQVNVIHAAYRVGIQKLLFLGSSCIYPRDAEQPINESALLTGKLEPTNEPYAIAKIAGIKLCESYNRQYSTDYRSVMPTNLYGPHDNYHPENSHVIPALLSRFHQAAQAGVKEVLVWGSGKPRREFLHVDDMANACVHVMNLTVERFQSIAQGIPGHINVGTGQDVTIREVSELIADIVGFKGNIVFDSSKPDGTFRKLLDVSLINSLGWYSTIQLAEGLQDAYRWFLQRQNSIQ